MHIVAFDCIYLLYSRLFPVDPQPPVVQECPYFPEDQYPSAELPGNQPLFDHSEITHSFSLLLALDFCYYC